MGGKNSAPPPPDYSGVAAASERAAELSYEVSVEQLAWAREQYASDMEILKPIIDSAMDRMRINDANADRDRERYEGIFQPLEDDLARDAQEYDTPERRQFEMERAQSDVAQQFEAQRRAAIQNLESYGVDPTSTRGGALDFAWHASRAAAQAGAGNQANAQTEAIGRALRSEAINVGRGYPGQVAGTYATALQSGNQGANTQLGGTASGASTMGTAAQWQGAGNQAVNTWGNTLNMGYNNALASADFNSRQSSGVGALAGAAMGMFSFSEGGAVPEYGVTPGGNVPAAASPTRGGAIDDVDAKLTAGEFVVPQEAVSWYGERHFQELIKKSQKERAEAPAKPGVSQAPRGPTTFQSRPSALPVGG